MFCPLSLSLSGRELGEGAKQFRLLPLGEGWGEGAKHTSSIILNPSLLNCH